jgi:hypothetical protein
MIMKMGVMLVTMFVIGFSDVSYAKAPKYCDMDTRTGIRIQSSNNNGPIPFEIVDHHTLCFKPAMKHFEYIVTNGMCLVYIPGSESESYMLEITCTKEVQKLAKI